MKSLEERMNFLEERRVSLEEEIRISRFRDRTKVHYSPQEYWRKIFLYRALDNVYININQVKQRMMNH